MNDNLIIEAAKDILLENEKKNLVSGRISGANIDIEKSKIELMINYGEINSDIIIKMTQGKMFNVKVVITDE